MQDKTKGLILMLLSALSFAVMAAMVRLSGDIPLFEKVLFRNLVSLLIAYISIKKSGDLFWGKKENRKFLLARAFTGLCGVVLYFYSVDNMFLADSSMLNKLSPFFVTFFAWLFLKEKISKIQIPSLIVIFFAATLIIKPELDLKILPAFAGFLSAMAAGGAYTLVRYLGSRERPSTIVFCFSFISVLGMIPLALIDFTVPTITQLLFLIGTGIFAAGGQFALTYAYKFAKASELAIYNYTNIIFSAIIGFIIWEEISDTLSIIGGSVIILVSLGVYLYNLRRAD